MEKLDDLIPIPSKNVMNTGLTSARESTMLKIFGTPGQLTKDCSDPSPDLIKQLVYGMDVGPFKVSGLRFAIESLKQIFDEVKEKLPEVYQAVKKDGVLCVRSRRTNPSKFSNHSWGSAIDIYFGSGVVEQGTPLTHRGVYLLFPFFNANGWYWGAEFSGDSVDSMHFELAEETVSKLAISVSNDFHF